VVTWSAFMAVHLALVVAFRLDRERLGPLWTLPLQQFVYCQLMCLVAVQSVLSAVTGARLRWHKVRRLDTSVTAATS